MPHQLRMCSNAHLQYAISIVIHKNQFVNKDFKAAVRLVIVQANFLSVLQLEIPSLLSASQHERAAVIAGMAAGGSYSLHVPHADRAAPLWSSLS